MWLASPAAAAVLAAIVWLWHGVEVTSGAAVLVAVAMIFLGLMMVSNFKYNSFKGIDFKGRVPFIAMLAIIFFFVIIASDPPAMLLTIVLLYSLSGPVVWLLDVVKRLAK